jgi:DNA-binding Xre family transcriptional regulator
MMKLKVREIAERVGIKNAAQLRARTGLGMKTSYQLWNGESELVSLQTLNTLCNVLQCGPALLLEYTPDLDTVQSESPPGQAEEPKARRARSSTAKRTGRKAASIGVAVG